MSTVMAVCSNKPRPQVQNARSYHMKTGEARWGKDVWHIAAAFGLTKCGRHMNGWLTIGQIEINSDCCKQCLKIDKP